MKITLLASLVLFAALAASAADNVSITIAGYDTMKFSVNKIEAKAGQKVTVTLRNEGNMPKEAMGHNFILLKAGSDPLAYVKAAIKAKAQDYQPPALANEVIASTRLLGPKESDQVTFTAPAPGTYAYFCSFPAHYQSGMKGVLLVK